MKTVPETKACIATLNNRLAIKTKHYDSFAKDIDIMISMLKKNCPHEFNEEPTIKGNVIIYKCIHCGYTEGQVIKVEHGTPNS